MLAIPSATSCEVCASSAQYFIAILVMHHYNMLPDHAIPPVASLDIQFPLWPTKSQKWLPEIHHQSMFSLNVMRKNSLKNYSKGENRITNLEEDCWAILAMLQYIQKEVINQCIIIQIILCDMWDAIQEAVVSNLHWCPCVSQKRTPWLWQTNLKWVKITNTHCSSFCSLSGVTNKLPGPAIPSNRPAFLMNLRTLQKNSFKLSPSKDQAEYTMQIVESALWRTPNRDWPTRLFRSLTHSRSCPQLGKDNLWVAVLQHRLHLHLCWMYGVLFHRWVAPIHSLALLTLVSQGRHIAAVLGVYGELQSPRKLAQ